MAGTFLPLTTQAAANARASLVLRRVRETEAAAGACWTALLAGCDSAGRWGLDSRLRQLSEATSVYVGTKWWFAEGSAHRRRVARAQADIEDAVADGDGQEFARAFVGYDHAMASAVVCGKRPARSPAL
ncbi:hypothetical protein [Amycolatopsis anabasis]|uniref:hypothetical protein n=1 Tax=Amycolatopsis anabasis TaxID=1840409 RepID=UPI00131ABF80|nr:hypothetical protein [Amycolatopsis anabasis]